MLVEAVAAVVACMKRALCDRNLVGCVECDVRIYMIECKCGECRVGGRLRLSWRRWRVVKNMYECVES